MDTINIDLARIRIQEAREYGLRSQYVHRMAGEPAQKRSVRAVMSALGTALKMAANRYMARPVRVLKPR